MDNKIIDNHYLEYELNVGEYWERHCVFARSYKVRPSDTLAGASRLTIVTAAGKLLVVNPVRNINAVDCKR